MADKLDELWRSRFMRVAFEFAGWSKDPRTKHGIVLVDESRNILQSGYNGMPSNFNDEILNTPEKNYFVIHAEKNAIIGAGRRGLSLASSTAFVTGIPCGQCASALLQAGVSKVYYHPLWLMAADTDWTKHFEMMTKYFPMGWLTPQAFVDKDTTAKFSGINYYLKEDGQILLGEHGPEYEGMLVQKQIDVATEVGF